MKTSHKKIALFRVYIVLFLLELVQFVDFLEDVPAKVTKTTFKILFLSIFLGFFISFLIYEQNTNNVNLLLTQLLNPRRSLVTNSVSQVLYPIVVNEELTAPQISAQNAIVVDIKNDEVLFEKNSGVRSFPASTTKLATALVALDLYDLNASLSVPFVCTTIDTQKIGFVSGELVSVKDLVYSMLVASAGDSACTLAYGDGDYNKFIDLMNDKAKKIGLEDTRFSNPVGLDADISLQVSTAYDLYLLGLATTNNKIITDAVSQSEYTTNTGNIQRYMNSTNKLLNTVQNSVGIKTGTTTGAGQVLIYRYLQGNTDLIIVVMQSVNREDDTQLLLNYVLEKYDFGV